MYFFLNNAIVQHPIQHINTGIKNIAKQENIALALGVTSILRYSEIVIHAMAGIKNSHLLTHTSFLSIGGIPLCIFDIKKNLAELPKASFNEKSNIFLKVVSKTSSIGYSTWTFLSALKNVGVNSKCLFFLPILGVASAALEGVSISFDVKGILEAYRISKQLNKAANLAKKVQDYTLADFQQGINFIEEQYNKESKFISNFFDVEDEKLVDHLFAVERIVQTHLFSSGQEGTAEKELLLTTMRSLRNRISLKKWSHVFNATIAATDILGVGLLLTPAAIAGYGCFAVAGSASIGLHLYNKGKSDQFKTKLLPF